MPRDSELSVERFKMPRSSKQILNHQRNHVARRLKPVTAVREYGPKKGNETHFGYKLHQKTDIDYCLIRETETSIASLHGSQVDLSTEGEVVLRDRGYFGAKAKGNDFTMKRRADDKPLGDWTL